jgi:carbonic anhydrase
VQQPSPPVRPHVILTCMDPRIDPASLFSFDPRSANILRNAGARVTPDVVRSVAVSAAVMQARELLIVQHTGCGMASASEPALRDAVKQRTGREPGDLSFMAIADHAAALQEDIERLRRSPAIPGDLEVRGYLLHLDTGELQPMT